MIPPFSQNSIELTVLPQPHTVHKNKRNIRIQTKPVPNRADATVYCTVPMSDRYPDIFSCTLYTSISFRSDKLDFFNAEIILACLDCNVSFYFKLALL